MSILRNSLLWMSENERMKARVPNMWFVRKALKKFMPGEKEEDAMDAVAVFEPAGTAAVFTKLGENQAQLSEADEVREHYLQLIDKIAERGLEIEISVKLTQLGFDFSEEETLKNTIAIAKKAGEKLKNTVFIDMESSTYTEQTIDFYKKCKKEVDNIGLCVQAYLLRTEQDILNLLNLNPALRIVKGAYKESAEIVFKSKAEVDENYFKLADLLLTETKTRKLRPIFATHDEVLINRIITKAEEKNVDKSTYEFQMLYGIKTSLQKKLAQQGYPFRMLISYGESWYPWYMRRLAERPANVWFVLKNIF